MFQNTKDETRLPRSNDTPPTDACHAKRPS
jgi:hypothetical protein